MRGGIVVRLSGYMTRSLVVGVLCIVAVVSTGGSPSARAGVPSIPSLAELPQCVGITQGATHLVDQTTGGFSVQPPDGFNPVTATDRQLSCYGFPMRPRDGQALQQWEQALSHATHYVAWQFGPATSPTTATTGSVCCPHPTYAPPSGYPWSGYGIAASKNGWTNLNWTGVQGQWIVPTGHNYCYNSSTGAQDSPWVGIGGDSWDTLAGDSHSEYLIQAGTDTTDWPTPVYRFFFEDYPNPQIVTLSPYDPPVRAGDQAYVSLTYNGNGTTSAFFQNVSTGNYGTDTEQSPLVNLHSAEFINEDLPNGWDFMNFWQVPFQLLYASGTWGNNYAISKSLSDSTVKISQFTAWRNDNSEAVASPGAINSSGDFTDNYTSSRTGC